MDLQRTEEWLAQRVGRITGSAAGAALGLSPWAKPEEIIRSMVREYHGAPSEFNDNNPALAWGTNRERQAILCFQRVIGLEVEDCGFFPYEDWSGASPDGLTSDGGVLEVKVPFGLRNSSPAIFKPLGDQPEYYAQVQLEMLCSGRTKAHFFQYVAPQGDVFSGDYVEEQWAYEKIEQDDDWLNEYIPQLKAFHSLYLSELDNKAHLEPLRVTIDSDEARHTLDRLGELEDALANLGDEKKALMASLIKMADGQNALVHGRKLTKVVKQGSVSYAKAMKELAPDADLEKYRGKEPESWRLS